MPEELICSDCGAKLSPDAQGGLCVRCLFNLGLKTEAGTETEPVVPITEKAGDRIGRYKLLQKIGEGGCGVVYMAEQEEPVRRRVALKVIKLGMDTREVIARFEAERQALAMMDHPNIAKILDAGVTVTPLLASGHPLPSDGRGAGGEGLSAGRPYFVMELVRGVKITEYCDQHNLPTRERLDLFIKVCQAIQHAHQKGIIHRDIKPSNILVTVNDGVPVPKVIDFGIAKATEGRLTDKTLFTAFQPIWATATDAEGLSTRSYHPFQVEPVPIPPPLNDHYTNRITLTGAPLIVTGTTVNATTELGEGGYHSVWWRWVAPASGPTTVTFTHSPHEANIYTGDAASAFECVGRPSIFFGSDREVFQAQAGLAYQIRVYLHVDLLPPGGVRFQILQSAPPTVTLAGPTNGSHLISGETVQLSASVAGVDWGISKVEFFSSGTPLGTFTNGPYTAPISFQTDYTTTREVYAVVTDTMGWSYQSGTFSYVIDPVPPDNDGFAGRMVLSGSSVSTTGSTEKATREAGEPGGGERSVWYSWTAPADGKYTLTVDGWLTNLEILAYTGTTLPTLALVGASTIEPGPGRYRARLTLDAVAGTLYQVAVIDAGAFSFAVSRGRAPSISIASPADGVALLRGSPTAFVVSVNDSDGDLRKVDFYLNQALLATVTNSPFSVEFAAQGLLIILPGGSGGHIGERYFLDAVATDEQGMETHAVSVTGDITRPVPHPATNDNFANRILLTGLLAGGRLEQEATASVELGEPDWLGDGGVGSTWWSWRAPGPGEVLIHCEAPFAVLTGPGTALSNLRLVGISQPNDWIHVSRFSAVAGTDYHIRVSTDYPSYRLHILLNTAHPALLIAQGIENGAMRLDFQTLAARDWIFHYSDNLRDWIPFRTNQSRLQNLRVIDPGASFQSRRFYQAVSAP